MTLDTLLIDHDDTLMSTFELRATVTAQAVAEVFGTRIDGAAFLARSHGRNLEQMGGEFSADAGLVDAFVRVYRQHYYSRNTEGLHVFEGVRELLEALAGRGVKLGVVTSKLGRGARAEQAGVGLDALLSVVIGAEDVTRPKPHAEPLEKALAQLGARAAGTLMLGDTPADIGAARNAGVASGGALWGCQDREALLAAAPDHVFERPAEVAVLFGAA